MSEYYKPLYTDVFDILVGMHRRRALRAARPSLLSEPGITLGFGTDQGD